MNVFDYAMKMELEGEEYYRGLAEATPHPGLKTIFTNLAADERKHFETFRALKGGISDPIPESSTLESSRNIFEKLVDGEIESPTLEHSLDGYRHGMENEAESAKFYEDAAKREKDENVARLIRRIADEEWDHYRVLENLYQYTLAPQNYLAWGEFGNLKAL